MEELSFVVRHPDGREDHMLVQGARAIIGSGAHCDIRLSPDQAAFEHVVIDVTADGARAHRLASSPEATLDGVLFSVASLPSSAMLKLGETTIRVERKATTDGRSDGKLGASAVAKAGVLLALGCAIALVAQLPQPTMGPPPASLPDVFGKAETDCPRHDTAEAHAVADDSRALADGARERSPFEPREAIAAVKAYDQAAACYRLAGQASIANEVSAIARELEDEVRFELRARRVRLERMLAVKDFEIARQDVIALRALTQGQRGDYIAWLAKVELELKNQKVERK